MANEASVFSYQGPTDVDRVITGEDAKVFRVSGLLFRFSPDQGGNVTTASPIRVFSENGEIIGFADVFSDDSGLTADLYLNYNLPCRLDMETGKPYYLKPICVEAESQVHIIDIALTADKVPGTDPVKVRS